MIKDSYTGKKFLKRTKKILVTDLCQSIALELSTPTRVNCMVRDGGSCHIWDYRNKERVT